MRRNKQMQPFCKRPKGKQPKGKGLFMLFFSKNAKRYSAIASHFNKLEAIVDRLENIIKEVAIVDYAENAA